MGDRFQLTEPVAVSRSPHIRTDFTRCDLCGSEPEKLLYSRIDPFTGMEFHLMECSCGMAMVNPMPLEESIHLLYPRDYLEGKRLKERMYRSMLDVTETYAQGRKLLDLGCGRGDFVHFATRAGWAAEGVDFIDWNRPFQDKIHVGDFLTMEFPPASYDVITAWALLEHVPQPSRFFEKVPSLLRDGGRFLFVVPNIAGIGMKTSCAEDIPRHLWIFTPETVLRYLDKNGMRAVDILHDGGVYRAYPFSLLRRFLLRAEGKTRRCEAYQNRAVALLRNRQIEGNMVAWLTEVLRELGPKDLLIDGLDLASALLLASISKVIRRYGAITVVAEKKT